MFTVKISVSREIILIYCILVANAARAISSWKWKYFSLLPKRLVVNLRRAKVANKSEINSK